MLRSTRTAWRIGALLASTCLLLVASSCRPELLVRLTTKVFHDGSLERRVEVRGWKAGGEVPTEEDWLASSVGLQLAVPDAWARVQIGSDRLEAQGFFLKAADLPPMFAYSTDAGDRTNRVRTQLEIDEKVVLRRWVYREFHGDPFGHEETVRALDGMIDLLAEALESELHRHFGDDLDTAPVRRVLHSDIQSLALAMITVGRSVSPGEDAPRRRAELWSQVLSQHGLATVPLEEPNEFWDRHGPLLVEWSRRRIAEALSTPESPLAPDALLPFWPDAEEPFPKLEEWLRSTWDDTAPVEKQLEAQINTIAGYYGRDSAPRFRFEISLEMPGTLLSTNGMPDGSGARWLFRNDDMSLSDIVLRAVTVEPIDEALLALGARRRFSPAQLMQLSDLLWTRDTQGALTGLLVEASEQGRLELLRDEAPEEHVDLARELADLLDPEAELR